ncbi:Gag-Pol polyprotein [Anthophora retusa]
MKTMFDHRPTKLALRRKFENRVWISGEPFVDYFHDKVILGNRVPIASDELVDYVIDGISDSQLRNQARIMRIRIPADLLESFENISLETGKSSDREGKGKRDMKETGSQQKEVTASTRSWGKRIKCFNCSDTGHISSKCPKPKRQQGSCFDCGSTSHLRSSCPRQAANQPGGSSRPKEPKCSDIGEHRTTHDASRTVHGTITVWPVRPKWP